MHAYAGDMVQGLSCSLSLTCSLRRVTTNRTAISSPKLQVTQRSAGRLQAEAALCMHGCRVAAGEAARSGAAGGVSVVSFSGKFQAPPRCTANTGT